MAESQVGELLAQVVSELAAGEVRDGQLEMADAVAHSLSAGTHAAIEAGTGTGKSFAYLVPAAISGKRVVVATATKALQDQLDNKDLPLVAKGLGLQKKFRWAVLKGRSNYLCRQRVAEIEEFGRQETLEGAMSDSRSLGPGSAPRAGSVGDHVARLVEWAKTAGSGDRAELDFEPQPRAWTSVSVSSDECPGAHRCPSGADCFAELARAKAARADVIVINIHLLGANLAGGGAVLPEHDALIVDEAHELEDILVASLGVELTPGRLRALAAGARPVLGERSTAAEALLSAAAFFEKALTEKKDQRLDTAGGGISGEIGDACSTVLSGLLRLEGELRQVSANQADPGGKTGNESPTDSAQRSLRSLLATERCREELESCIAAGASDVVWVVGGDRVALRSAPLDVSNVLSAQVFSVMPVVLTSATLPDGLAARLGATRSDVTELDVGSPFDYKQNGLLYCAHRLPDRRRPGAEEAMHVELEELIEAAEGRTLGLFTSYRAMTAAAAALRPRISWPIHVQGDLPKPALLETFAREEEACLFATMGFWQGVDVPGPTLSLVVIDRIPFPRPDDPLMSARRDAAGAMGFRVVDLPRAAMLLAQGAGRLIRTSTDRGVVAVLDPRLATASYSGYLVKALPPMRRTKEQSEAVAFLKAIASGA